MAWTDIPDFTVGQVLTSSRMNNMRDNANIGHRICTSTTRPTSPDEGTMIYEADTNRTLVWNGSAWTYTSTLVVTSATRPAASPTGTTIYETDTGKVFVWTGAAWNQVATQNAPVTGSVVQMQSGFTQTEVGTTSSARVDTGINATITPRFSTSTILIQAQIATRRATGSNAGIGFDIRRNGTVVLNQGTNYYLYNNPDTSAGLGAPLFYVDSPASTSALTYRIFFGSWSGTTVEVQDDGQFRSYIILWEIAA
jgi:hypothetical protein